MDKWALPMLQKLVSETSECKDSEAAKGSYYTKSRNSYY